MSIININKNFNTQNKCVKYLESLRWADGLYCIHCGTDKSITKRKKSMLYHCNNCNKDFSVCSGTIFDNTRLPLPKWFLMIDLILNAKKGISSSQLCSNLDITYKTSWLNAMKIRCGMVEDIELNGVVESDEMYVGGKPRKTYKNDSSNTQMSMVSDDGELLQISNSKRGRGTSKAKVAGMVERKGKIVLKLMEAFNTRTMLSMLKNNVDVLNSVVITDEARFYNGFDDAVEHIVIKHKESFAKGNVHINTIEGFWSIIKGGIKGNYRSLSKKYLPFYLAEFAYRFNRRNETKLMFEDYIKNALSKMNCMVNAEPVKEPTKIFYKRKKRKKDESGRTKIN